MFSFEYRHRETGRLVARVEGSSNMPAPADHIYAPSAADAGAYSHLRVTGREFYYDQQGKLTLVKLECVEVTSQPVG